MSNSSTDPPDLYAILLESQKQGVWNIRQIIVGGDPATIFDEFSSNVLSAGELVYEGDMFRTSHSDLAEFFSGTVEAYQIPDGDEDCLSGCDVFPALQLLIENEKRKIEQGVDLAELVNECNSFLDGCNYWLWDESYVAVTVQGWLPGFGSQLLVRQLSIFSERHRMLGVQKEQACWFGRLSMLMAMKGPWLGAHAYDTLLELIVEFNEMYSEV